MKYLILFLCVLCLCSNNPISTVNIEEVPIEESIVDRWIVKPDTKDTILITNKAWLIRNPNQLDTVLKDYGETCLAILNPIETLMVFSNDSISKYYYARGENRIRIRTYSYFFNEPLLIAIFNRDTTDSFFWKNININTDTLQLTVVHRDSTENQFTCLKYNSTEIPPPYWPKVIIAPH